MDELLARTDLVGLVGEYVQLTKKGGTYWGCCPFHHEKTPSFSVNGDKQMYYCFGACHEGGNAVTFIKKIESVDGRDAVRILAKRVGLEVPETTYTQTQSPEKLKHKERLYALMRTAARHYHDNLKSAAGQKVVRYLHGRGITDSVINRFGLGYSVNGTDLIDHLTAKGFTSAEMKDANVLAVSEKGSYDPFYDRMMVPIINQFGEVCAFGGRTLVKDPDFAKYRNSSTTPIFEKGRVVFAANLLQKLKKQGTKIEYVILCEGYMDVIALQTHGFTTSVACMGTALTFAQAKQIKNFTQKVYISFDGDVAGQKNALKGLDILAQAGLSVRVIELPDGLDPDDVIQKHGKLAYQKLLDNAITLPAFKIKMLQAMFDLTDVEEKAKFGMQAIRVIKALESAVEQEEYLNVVQKMTGYTQETLLRQLNQTAAQEVDVPSRNVLVGYNQENQKAVALSHAETFVLASLAAQKSFVDYTENFTQLLSSDFSITVANFFVGNSLKKIDSVASLYAKVNEEEHSLLDEILNGYQFIEGDNQDKYIDCIRTLKEGVFKKEKAQLESQWTLSKDMELLKRIAQIDAQIQSLKSGGEL